MFKFIHNALEGQKPLNQLHVTNDKASISCMFLKHDLNFNTPCDHIPVWLSAMDESPHHPTGSEAIQILCDNCCLPTCLVLKFILLFQTPEAVLQSSAMYPTYDSTCFISSSAVVLTSSIISCMSSPCIYISLYI